jgi:NAD(P)-dependent dehydrogenase (short-subunit alcohol dehydrogenase family)
MEKRLMSPTTQRTAVITGASSGIGFVTAKHLVSQGWNVIALGRDPERSARAQAELTAAAAGGGRVEMIRGDLAVMSEVVAVAREIAAHTPRIDVLINNAGGTAAAQLITSEGNEATFASNHLGHFLLTHRLMPLLEAAAAKSAPGDTRILNVSSSAHEFTPGLNWNDLQMFENFVPITAYCNAKLANILFTRLLAKRLQGTGIVVHAMHPGAVATNFWARADEGTQRHGQQIELISAEEAADTLIWLATSSDAGRSSGGYFHQRKPIAPSALAQDEQSAERLWKESEKLVAAHLA